MSKTVLLLCVVLFGFENIMSKSFLLHEKDFLNGDENGIDERQTPKAKFEGGVTWKRIDLIPRKESLVDNEENDAGNDFLMQQLASHQKVKENEDAPVTSEDEIFEKRHFSDNSRAEILDGANIIADGSSLDQLSATSPSELNPYNLTNSIIIDFSNVTGDAIVLDTFIDNADDIDEVSEMSKGEEIAILHEMPTSSFEFLIDAQTRRNIQLKELLSSQTIFFEENDTEPAILDELEHSLLENLRSHGNNTEDIILNDHSGPVDDASEADEMVVVDTTSSETGLSNSSENIAPECPQPGWCIFWFLSQDTCAENSHCLGSRICCKTGCSKTCVDV